MWWNRLEGYRVSRGSSSRVLLLTCASVVLPSHLLYDLLGGTPTAVSKNLDPCEIMEA